MTQELVIMQSWRFIEHWLPPLANTFVIVVPATILFAWFFFWFCERPFMVRRKKETSDRRSQWTPIVESQPSTVSD